MLIGLILSFLLINLIPSFLLVGLLPSFLLIGWFDTFIPFYLFDTFISVDWFDMICVSRMNVDLFLPAMAPPMSPAQAIVHPAMVGTSLHPFSTW